MDKKQKNIVASVAVAVVIVIAVALFARGKNFQGMLRPRPTTPPSTSVQPTAAWATFSETLGGAYFSTIQYPTTWQVGDDWNGGEYFFYAQKSDNSASLFIMPVGPNDPASGMSPPKNAQSKFVYIGGKKAARYEWKSGDVIYVRYVLTALPKSWTSANHIDLKGKAADQAALNQMLTSIKFVN